MLDSFQMFINNHQIALLASLLLSLKISSTHFQDAYSILFKITGFRYDFWQSTFALFVCIFLVALCGFRGIVAVAVFLLTLRALWVIELAFYLLDETS